MEMQSNLIKDLIMNVQNIQNVQEKSDVFIGTSIFVVLMPNEVNRINNKKFLSAWRRKLDAQPTYACNRAIPFVGEDYLYDSSGYTERGEAEKKGREHAAGFGEKRFAI